MRIYQPVRGVGSALRENSFIIIDDAGVEIGQGGLDYRINPKYDDTRPLEIEMMMNAHPAAADTLFGALTAGAERIKAKEGNLPARIYIRCPLNDSQRRQYFLSMGYDDTDGEELFVLTIQQTERKRNYSPVGTKIIDADLHTRARREEFLLRMKDLGDAEHAEEWLNDKMRGTVFIAKTVYYGSEFVGLILITGTQKEAVLNMVGVEPKWRGRHVASSLIEEGVVQLSKQQVPYLMAVTPRRNKNAVRMFRRCQFEWIQTQELLLGKDM